MVNDAGGFVFIAAGRVSDITRPLYLPFQPKGTSSSEEDVSFVIVLWQKDSSLYRSKLWRDLSRVSDNLFRHRKFRWRILSTQNFRVNPRGNILKKIIHRNVIKTYFSRKSSAIISPLINSKVLFSIPREVNVPRLSPPLRYKTRHAIEESIEGLKRATGSFRSTRVLPKRGVTRGSREEEGKRRGSRDSLERRFPVPPPCKSFIPLVAGLLHGGYCITGLNI